MSVNLRNMRKYREIPALFVFIGGIKDTGRSVAVGVAKFEIDPAAGRGNESVFN